MVLAPYHVHYEADDHVGRDDFELFKEQTQNQIDDWRTRSSSNPDSTDENRGYSADSDTACSFVCRAR